jgi:hypothetical protein
MFADAISSALSLKSIDKKQPAEVTGPAMRRVVDRESNYF